MIDSFKGEYAFLSNLFAVPGGVAFEGRIYPTVENAFQAAKSPEGEEREQYETVTPALARRMGRKVELNGNWDYARVGIMQELIRTKFAERSMMELLLATGDEKLVEGNTTHDNYWGMCNCPRCKGEKGLNWLGRILMTARSRITAGEDGSK